jgi:hypothetical protein
MAGLSSEDFAENGAKRPFSLQNEDLNGFKLKINNSDRL